MRIYRNIPFITIYLQPRKLKVHPVIIPLPPQGHAAFIFHELPKGIIIRSGKGVPAADELLGRYGQGPFYRNPPRMH